MRNLWAPYLAVFAILFALGQFAGPAAADELDQYRASGDIIERYDGLVEAAPSAPANVKSLVTQVNTKRQSVYARRAAQNNVPASAVAKIFAEEIFGNAPAGTKFRQPNGSIVQK